MKIKSFFSLNKKIKKEKKKFPGEYIGHTSKTFGDKQFKLYKKRLEKVRLTWCQQVFEIIKKLNYSNPKINDLGWKTSSNLNMGLQDTYDYYLKDVKNGI